MTIIITLVNLVISSCLINSTLALVTSSSTFDFASFSSFVAFVLLSISCFLALATSSMRVSLLPFNGIRLNCCNSCNALSFSLIYCFICCRIINRLFCFCCFFIYFRFSCIFFFFSCFLILINFSLLAITSSSIARFASDFLTTSG